MIYGLLKKAVFFLYMTRLEKCIHIYIGCDTNKGKLVGVRQDCLLVKDGAEGDVAEYNTQALGRSLFLYLQHLNDLTEEQSQVLIEKGFAIGRPNGYTFSNESFLYLTGLNVDLFGLIKSGYAKRIMDVPGMQPAISS